MIRTQEILFGKLISKVTRKPDIHNFINTSMRINNFKYFTFTYLDTSFEQLKDYILKRWKGDSKYKTTCTPFKFDLYELSPPKGGAHFEKMYFFTPKSCGDKSIMFSNYSDGLSSLVYQITSALRIKAYCFRISISDIPDAINAFSCIEKGKELRTVYAMRDPGWKFYCQGKLQPFEDEGLYRRKMIKQRLNKYILISYCIKLGLDIRNDSFWESQQSILIERLVW